MLQRFHGLQIFVCKYLWSIPSSPAKTIALVIEIHKVVNEDKFDSLLEVLHEECDITIVFCKRFHSWNPGYQIVKILVTLYNKYLFCTSDIAVDNLIIASDKATILIKQNTLFTYNKIGK